MTHNTLKKMKKKKAAGTKLICKIKPREMFGVHTCESDSTMIFTAVLLCNVFNSQEISHLLKKSFSICKTLKTAVTQHHCITAH